MTKNIVLICMFFFIAIKGATQELIQIPEKTTKILFLGNSITYQGNYIAYIETFFALKYPDKRLEFINVGLPSETVSGLSEENHANGKFPRPDLKERLQRVLSKVKPDLVFANYGINDGIYLPFDEVRFQKFKFGSIWMHANILKTGNEVIHLTPPVFDGEDAETYDNVMHKYSSWLLSMRQSHNWKVIDIHGPMKTELTLKRISNPKFTFAPDGVHQNSNGHWIMAQQVLLILGETEVKLFGSFEEAISKYENGLKVFELIKKRQFITRDAWLSTIGHLRPGLPEGKSIKEALKEYEQIQLKIDAIIKQ